MSLNSLGISVLPYLYSTQIVSLFCHNKNVWNDKYVIGVYSKRKNSQNLRPIKLQECFSIFGAWFENSSSQHVEFIKDLSWCDLSCWKISMTPALLLKPTSTPRHTNLSLNLPLWRSPWYLTFFTSLDT